MSIKRINEFPEGSGSLSNDDVFLFMDDPSNGGTTKKISLSQIGEAIGGGNASVESVAGKTGVITLDKNDVGLGNVDDTSDANKPVSTAAQTALNSKLSESTDRYIVCKTGDSIAAKYAEAKTLTPGGSSLSSTNRAYLVVMPGTYPLSSQWEIDAEFVDVIGLGSSSLGYGCKVAVIVQGWDLNVSANDVSIKGIGTNEAFKISGNKNLQVFEECSGGRYSFGYGNWGQNTAGTFINCSSVDYGWDSPSGIFINCIGGSYSFRGNASGTFINCSGGMYSFGSYGTASGSFRNCIGGHGSFGTIGTSSGSFFNCSAGPFSFGHSATANGRYYYCHLTGGLFPALSSTGLRRLCIDGNNDINNDNA